MPKYAYNGQTEIKVYGLGIVKPGQIVNVPFDIVHPDFELKSAVVTPVKKRK